jgi:hypothetical protein
MVSVVLCLFGLCSAFIAHGLPIDVNISPPEPRSYEDESDPSGIDAKLLGGGEEGDMFFPKTTNGARGVAIFGDKFRWPQGTIPYDISSISVAGDRQKITDAMQALMYDVASPKPGTNERTACVFFRPRQAADKVYFKIQYGNGCSAHVGYMTNQQSVMTLQQNGCFSSQTIQHELLHIVGFQHEQCRPDRDTYLQVNLANVNANMHHNFNKYVWGSSVLNQGTKYDYGSIMHYGTNSFSNNGKPTLVPRTAGVSIGTAKKLSPIDIAEVRNLYRCSS